MFEILSKGGIISWIIVLNSMVATVIFFERLLHLHRAQIKTNDFLEGIYTIVRRGNIPESISMCDNTPGPVAHVTRAALLHFDLSHNEMTNAVEHAGMEEIPRLEQRLRALMTAAQLSPLLGLLGTVLGLATTLISLEGNAPLVHIGDVSGGMWSALICTAIGLIVAIPAYAGYNLLVSRVEGLVLDMEQASTDIVHFLLQTRKEESR
ncbi:MotA/TolQ/ExbB proton channel family protein [Verrucomicrobiota bacterium]